MSSKELLSPNALDRRVQNSVSATVLATSGKIEVEGQQYVTAGILAEMLGVTARTLCRWDAARTGPPKIKIGKLVLFNLAKLPGWLARYETEPVRAVGRRTR